METYTVRACTLIMVILLVSAVAGGCGAVYYAPGRVPTPQFDSTHDTYLAGGYDFVSGVQGEVALSPIRHIWITGHIDYTPFIDSADLPSGWADSYAGGLLLGQIHTELGVGWYSGHGRKFALLAGCGRGRATHMQVWEVSSFDTIPPAADIGRGDFETYFLQISGISLSVASNAYAQLMIRGEYIRFTQFSLNSINQPPPSVLIIRPVLFTGMKLSEDPASQLEIQAGSQIRFAGSGKFLYDPIFISLTLLGLFDLL
jgi:hypothetical protein